MEDKSKEHDAMVDKNLKNVAGIISSESRSMHNGSFCFANREKPEIFSSQNSKSTSTQKYNFLHNLTITFDHSDIYAHIYDTIVCCSVLIAVFSLMLLYY